MLEQWAQGRLVKSEVWSSLDVFVWMFCDCPRSPLGREFFFVLQKQTISQTFVRHHMTIPRMFFDARRTMLMSWSQWRISKFGCRKLAWKWNRPLQAKTWQQKHPAGPETVPIKRTFLKNMVILPQCRADLMIGNPGKTWGAFFWLFSVIAATHAPLSAGSQHSCECISIALL